MDPKTEHQVITDTIRQRAKRFDFDVGELSFLPVLVTPPEHTVHNLEHLLEQPTRMRGTIKATTPMSFVRAVEDGCITTARVYVDERAGTFTAVLNHGGQDDPGWGDYRVTYAPAYSLEFEPWLRICSTPQLSQSDLVRFLEDYYPDISSMSGGDALAMVRDFRVSMSGSFASATNLSNGSIEFAYSMENRGKGSIEVPEVLVITLPMFEGTEAIQISVRFRYRLNEGALKFTLELAGFDRVRRDELRKIRALVAEHLNEYAFLDGARVG